jgi:hypothetical protein
MGDLAVTVRLHGAVVEDRVVPVRRMVRLGENRKAKVSFPGADVTVVRVGQSLAVRGHILEEGDEIAISLGALDVRFAHTVKTSTPSEWGSRIDVRFLAAALVVTAVGTWIDAAEPWMDHQGHLARPRVIQTILEAMRGRPAEPVKAAVSPATEDAARAVEAPRVAEGPVHRSDDLLTGTGYYAWYRNAVLSDPYIEEGFSQVALDRTDAGARRRLARDAYNHEDWDSAARLYGTLSDADPEDRCIKLHLAWAERRRGRHEVEAALYREILALVPNDVLAQSGLAVALARLGRMDEASVWVDGLQVLAPMDPTTDLAIALVAAIQGHDDDAIAALDRALAGRAQLSEELRLEMRRDLALDPALSSLRKTRRLGTLLHKHLGAAAPRPVR